jgi:hypothetical protein
MELAMAAAILVALYVPLWLADIFHTAAQISAQIVSSLAKQIRI